jgi:hypothetical protein
MWLQDTSCDAGCAQFGAEIRSVSEQHDRQINPARDERLEERNLASCQYISIFGVMGKSGDEQDLHSARTASGAAALLLDSHGHTSTLLEIV